MHTCFLRVLSSFQFYSPCSPSPRKRPKCSQEQGPAQALWAASAPAPPGIAWGSASPRQPPGDLFPVPRPLILLPGSLPAVPIQELAPRRTPRDELGRLGGTRCTLAGRQSGSISRTFTPLVGRQMAAALRPSLPSGASVTFTRAETQPPSTR